MKHENILSLIGSDASTHSRPYPDILHVHKMTTPWFQNMINLCCFDLQNQDINNGVSIKLSGNWPTDLTTYFDIVLLIFVLIIILIITYIGDKGFEISVPYCRLLLKWSSSRSFGYLRRSDRYSDTGPRQ